MAGLKKNLPESNKELLLHHNNKDFTFLKFIALTGQLGSVMVANIVIWFFLIRWLISLAGLNLGLQFIGIVIGIFVGGFSCYKLLEKHLKLKKTNE